MLHKDRNFLSYIETSQIVGGAFLAVFAAIGGWGDFYCALLLWSLWIVFAVYVLVSARKKFRAALLVDSDTALLESAMQDSLLHMPFPTVILTENGQIVWYNQRFETEIATVRDIYGHTIYYMYEKLYLSDVLACSDPEGFPFEAGDKSYRLFATITGSINTATDTRFIILYWKDYTETQALIDDKKLRAPAVALIAIDNFDELLQASEDNCRTASLRVAEELTRWTEKSGGILREVDRETYLFVFERFALDRFVQERFSILDTVKEITVGSADMPVTLSIGIGYGDEGLGEKQEMARQALDTALYRGGDQAVVKSAEGMEFYGGRSKAIERKNKVRSRVMADKLAGLVRNAGNVLVMGHKFADLDAIGACAGIARLSLALGKPVNIVVNPYVNMAKPVIQKLLGSPLYRDIFVDTATGLDLVRSDTLAVVVDVSRPNYCESSDIIAGAAKCAVIDHHRKSADSIEKAEMTYIEPSASSACELIAEMLEHLELGDAMLREEADAMLAGISLDTKSFSRKTGVRTFAAASFLRKAGADPLEVKKLFRVDMEPFRRKMEFESNAFIYKKIIAVSALDGKDGGYDKLAMAQAADELLTVNGITAAFVLCRVDKNVHISARSMEGVNVQLICEKLGGGGHQDEAGAQLVGVPVEVAQSRLLRAIDEYFNDLADLD